MIYSNNYAMMLSIIKRALNKNITQAEAADFLSSLNYKIEPTLCNMVHAVVHFISDEDIRENDPEYDAKLKQELFTYLDILNTPE